MYAWNKLYNAIFIYYNIRTSIRCNNSFMTYMLEDMMTQVGYITAFTNGFLSFFLPCVLPMLPLYYSYLVGETLTAANHKRLKTKLMINSFAFSLGLTLMNVFLGFGVYALTGFFVEYRWLVRIVGGIIMIAFGLYFLLDRPFLPFMEKDYRRIYQLIKPTMIGSFLLGFTFSLGWSACNGPIIASITMIASFQRDYIRAGFLMLAYSAGFSVMFLASALLFGLFAKRLTAMKKVMMRMKQIAGIILIIMGILLMTGYIFVV